MQPALRSAFPPLCLHLYVAVIPQTFTVHASLLEAQE